MRKLIYILAFSSISMLLGAQGSKPNIIFMMADDLGYSDISTTGSPYDTPSIDSLANQGVFFARHYAYPACTPTRGALMTGRYPLRYALWQVVISRYDSRGISASENKYMLPRLLKEAGYQTAIIGKWHLGHMYPEYLPHTRGFDYAFGTAYGLVDYYDWSYENATDCRENGNFYPPSEHNGPTTYFTDAIADKCEDYLDSWANCSNSPFFLFVPFTAPHIAPYGIGDTRVQIPIDSLANAPTNLTSTQRRYWVMMRQLDYAVSRIVNKVRDLGIEEETIIIFASDNGGDVDYGGNNAPFRGEKNDLTEGGIRVPAIWYHKNTVSPAVVNEPIQIEDFHPTLLKIAGRDISDIEANLDGEDISPLLSGGTIQPRMFIKQYQRTNNVAVREWAVISGDYKLCSNCGTGTPLYNVTTDLGELTDISGSNPAIVSQLMSYANSFEAATQYATGVYYNFTPPSGWNTIQKWAVPETFYDPDYYYYRNPKN
jgi:arylsulfatase A-like enzyme